MSGDAVDVDREKLIARLHYAAEQGSAWADVSASALAALLAERDVLAGQVAEQTAEIEQLRATALRLNNGMPPSFRNITEPKLRVQRDNAERDRDAARAEAARLRDAHRLMRNALSNLHYYAGPAEPRMVLADDVLAILAADAAALAETPEPTPKETT